MPHTTLMSQQGVSYRAATLCPHSAAHACTSKLRCSSSLHALRETQLHRAFCDHKQVGGTRLISGRLLVLVTYLTAGLNSPGLQVLLHKQHSRKRKCPVQCQAESQSDYRTRSKQDVRIVVAGSTGYIGKYVTKELIKRGYNVVAFAREKSGVGGKQSREQTQKVDLSLSM